MRAQAAALFCGLLTAGSAVAQTADAPEPLVPAQAVQAAPVAPIDPAAAPPPSPERVEIAELPLPPVAPSAAAGSCTSTLDPKRTGCMAGDRGALHGAAFLPDGEHVVARVRFAGAAAGKSPSGDHLVVIKASGGAAFANGQAWKCLTCAAPSRLGGAEEPQAFADGKRVLVGGMVFDCAPLALADERCKGGALKAVPIFWQISAEGAGGGVMQGVRLHPDNEHIGFNAPAAGGELFPYLGRLRFDRGGSGRSARYVLDYVNVLVRPGIEHRTLRPAAKRGRLAFDRKAIDVLEFRGFSGDGREAAYLGYPWESSNADLFAVDLASGAVRRLTSDPGYPGAIDFSPDGKWLALGDTRASGRMTAVAGLRRVPPLTDLLTQPAVAVIAGGAGRRYFNPVLLDAGGDRGDYTGQSLVGGGGDASDPNWNQAGGARWSPDSTRLVYAQDLAPGMASPAPGGRRARLMLARFTGRAPAAAASIQPLADQIAWATAYVPGDAAPQRGVLPVGAYELAGAASGKAQIVIVQRNPQVAIDGVSVSYSRYSDDGRNALNGVESVSETPQAARASRMIWQSNLAQAGPDQGRKLTGPGDLNLRIDDASGRYEATGTLITNVRGQTSELPRPSQ